MYRLLGCILLGLAACAAGLGAQGDKGTRDGKKEAKAGNEVVGKVKAVDLKKQSFTITTDAGKDRTFLVDDKTRFVGPRGGVSKEGLKDDRLAKGAEVEVTPAPDGKAAREVKLPFRKKGKIGSVSGKVLYKGRPVTGGSIAFHSAEGKVFAGAIHADGTYDLQGVPLGAAKVTVETESLKGSKLKTPPKDKGGLPKEGEGAPRYLPIPRQYAEVNTSPLRYTVTAGKQTFDIDLR
jgi:hypothetical protein